MSVEQVKNKLNTKNKSKKPAYKRVRDEHPKAKDWGYVIV